MTPILSTTPQITHSAYINNDELYSSLTTYSFGAPGTTRSSTPDSDIRESELSSRYLERHQRPRRSLSSVPTPRDEMEIDEAEISRNSRAKMRAIDDGGRRPSLPKNPASPPLPPSTLSIRTSADVLHRSEPSSTDHVMDDRASTYTFGVPGMYHLSDSEQSSYLDEEPLDQLSTSPITFAYTPPAAGDDEEARRNSFVVPIGHDIQLRRGSIPLAIPETPRQDNQSEMTGHDETQSARKLSRSLGDDASNLDLGDTSSTDQAGGSSRSEPMSKADWSSFKQSIESRTTPTIQSLRRLSTQEGDEEDNPNAYTGLDLAYILGSGADGGHRGSWSSESFVQRRPSVTQTTGGFVGFAFSFGRDADRRPSVATAGEDTFLRHLQHNDANYALRLEEWTFGKEKADASGPRLSGLTAGGVVAPTIGPGTFELWRCHMTGRFHVERLALQCSSPIYCCAASLSHPFPRSITLTANSFPFMGFVVPLSRTPETPSTQDGYQTHYGPILFKSSRRSRGHRTQTFPSEGVLDFPITWSLQTEADPKTWSRSSTPGYKPIDPPRHEECSRTIHEYEDHRSVKDAWSSRGTADPNPLAASAERRERGGWFTAQRTPGFHSSFSQPQFSQEG